MMERVPKFIRDFSRESASGERSEVARQIKQKRVEHFAEKKRREKERSALEKDVREKSQEIEKLLSDLDNLEVRLREVSSSMLKKIWNVFQLRRIRAQMQTINTNHNEAHVNRNDAATQLEEFDRESSEGDMPEELREANALVHNFYADQKERWANSDHNREDIERYFTEEHLASLDIDEYALLLKRFPSQMITHVTRQGIRDHANIEEHSIGQGEYFDGFMCLLKDGRLRSPLAVRMMEKEKEIAMTNLLHLSENSREKSLENIERMTSPDDQWSGGSYADMRAVHFATERVADAYYGSEAGNEIFFAYPSAFIAAKYYFAGDLHGHGDTGDQYNDQWVWDSEEKGMDIDAGIVFIPGKVRVDRRTGSRYELDDNNKPTKNEAYRNILRTFLESDDFNDFVDRRFQKRGNFKDMDLRKDGRHPDLSIRYNYLSMSGEEDLREFEPLVQELKDRYAINDKRMLYAMVDYKNLQDLQDIKKSLDAGKELLPHQDIDKRIDHILEREGILYKETTDTVSAEEFWENYFQEHPNERPSKVVFYGAVSPTRAMFDWRSQRGLTKKSEDDHIGFSEKQVSKNSEQGSVGMDRFKELAIGVIEQFYEGQNSRAPLRSNLSGD